MNNPLISIVIPAKNAERTIKKCIDSILHLNYSNYEVMVINDGSADNTAKILVDYPNIQILTTTGVGPAKAKNIGISQAKGEFVAFTDADCIVDTDWIVELLKGFINEKIVGVGGSQKSPSDDSAFGKKVHDFLNTFGFVSGYMKSASRMKLTNHNPSCNVMYRKSILLELGGFLEGLWPGEDVELDYRIKKKNGFLMFNPKAIVYHYRPSDWRTFCKMMFRYGRAQGYLVRKYGFFRKVHFVPIFLFILVLLLLCNIFFGFLAFILIVMVLFIKSLMKSRTPLVMLRFLPIAIFIWNLGFLSGLFKKK